MAEINLLPEEERAKIVREVVKKKFNFFNIGALILITAATIVVFGYWGLVSRTNSKLNQDITQREATISNFAEVETLARLLKNKAAGLVSIFSAQADFGKMLETVATFVPSGVVLSDLTVSEAGKLTLSGEAISSAEFSSLLNAFVDPNLGGRLVSAVSVESLSRDEAGIYKFSISSTLVGGQ